MKAGSRTIIAGIILIVGGLVLFFSIDSNSDLNQSFRWVKHAGTFAGLLGIGVTMAGILLYLIGREQPNMKEDFDF